LYTLTITAAGVSAPLLVSRTAAAAPLNFPLVLIGGALVTFAASIAADVTQQRTIGTGPTSRTRPASSRATR